MNFQAALNFLLAGEELVLTTHVHADGDGLGALLGLSHWLTRQDQKHRIVVADETPDRKYRFLPGYDRIESVYRSIPVVPRLVVVDTTTSKKRIGDVADLIGPATKTLVIDHHVNEEEVGDVRVIDTDASSASELIYSLINWYGSNSGFTPEIATCLYAGIVFDTKLFKHSHPERALRAAAELVGHGADPQQIAENMFSHQTYQTVKTLGFALSNLMLHENGQISTLYVDHKTHAMNGDLDGVIDHAMSIDGVEVALFFKEQEPGQQRVSLRSRGKVDVNRIARQFDGGGHIRASGCEIKGSVGQVQARLISLVREQL
ncbi:MAG: DHH family phosphoesterase [Gemmatimonadota bacterium]|nr:DHH family phosphoesterase [Gemmatimonadota bacterium]